MCIRIGILPQQKVLLPGQWKNGKRPSFILFGTTRVSWHCLIVPFCMTVWELANLKSQNYFCSQKLLSMGWLFPWKTVFSTIEQKLANPDFHTWFCQGYIPTCKISLRSDKWFHFCACVTSRSSGPKLSQLFWGILHFIYHQDGCADFDAKYVKLFCAVCVPKPSKD